MIMTKLIKKLLNYIMRPPGKYETIDGISSARGESLSDLFKRRNLMIKQRIERSYPIMSYVEFMTFPTKEELENRTSSYRLKGLENGLGDYKIGIVFYPSPSNHLGELKVYRII
jgi:hypothetical protein